MLSLEITEGSVVDDSVSRSTGPAALHALGLARSRGGLTLILGLRVVAEGVEDELTRKLLAEMGCDKLQGFLVSRPLPDDRLESWLLARPGVRAAAPGATHRRLFVRASARSDARRGLRKAAAAAW